ncbi:putrescine transport system permease protein [Stella humosa]|uniref:Putrescine transport system permease protein n=1 Tax=Stella humosa TaxID=94 RepID=A0A3N1KUQ8_9PROT|nr:ABC transporter permease subunit [Stella humosa]ROP83724.1 putrescine transport system permease protein [Stella humosa]
MSRPRRDGAFARLTLLLPYGWLLLFLLVPFLIVVGVSLSTKELGTPPFVPPVTFAGGVPRLAPDFGNYAYLLDDPLYVLAYLNSLKVALLSTVACLLLGYPMAYGIVRAPARWRPLLLTLVILPFWTSFLIRVYAWIGILAPNGILNNLLLGLGWIGEPLVLLSTEPAVILGIVYSYLPFMILPLYATLERLDPALMEAAADLGCRPVAAFLRVTLPLSLPGMLAGSMLVFVPAVGEFVIPDLLGGTDTLMIGKVVWDEFFSNTDWPVASAVATALLVVLILPLLLLQRFQGRQP